MFRKADTKMLVQPLGCIFHSSHAACLGIDRKTYRQVDKICFGSFSVTPFMFTLHRRLD